MFIGIFRNIFRSWATILFVLKVQRSYFGRIARFLQGNRLISKEIRQTFTIEKNWCSQNLDFLENKCLFWHYHLQLSFIYKTVPQISFNLFCSGDKRIFVRVRFIRGWFHGHNKRFPISWLKIKISKNWVTVL